MSRFALDETMAQWKAIQWNMYLEEGKLIEVTRHARRVGIKCKVVVTAGLFKELAPFAEEATKGHSLDERMDDMFKEFDRSRQFATRPMMEFDVRVRHMVKSAVDVLNPEVYKTNADKKLTIVAGTLIDDNSHPALVFALRTNAIVQAPA